MVRRWSWAAARPIPPKMTQIRRAKSGVELPPEEPGVVVPVGGGVAVSPWKDSNGVSLTIGVAVSPWKDSNGVSVGACVGGSVRGAPTTGVSVGAWVGGVVGGAVTTGVSVGAGNDWYAVGLGDGVEHVPPLHVA
jgi:hypothetical protein